VTKACRKTGFSVKRADEESVAQQHRRQIARGLVVADVRVVIDVAFFEMKQVGLSLLVHRFQQHTLSAKTILSSFYYPISEVMMYARRNEGIPVVSRG
jgi:hypothetical protein